MNWFRILVNRLDIQHIALKRVLKNEALAVEQQICLETVCNPPEYLKNVIKHCDAFGFMIKSRYW